MLCIDVSGKKSIILNEIEIEDSPKFVKIFQDTEENAYNNTINAYVLIAQTNNL